MRDDTKGIQAAVAAVVVLALTGLLLSPYGPSLGGSEMDAMDRACVAEFGDGYDGTQYIGGNPPVIGCEAPDGTVIYMDMPKEIAKDKGMSATAYDEN